jgi:hypothetical protein
VGETDKKTLPLRTFLAAYNTIKKSHTNQSITIMGDGLRSGVEQEQGFVGARQRRQQLLEQELKEQKRVLEIAVDTP